MNPLFSIIVPVYNRAHCVTRTLDSIVASTYRPLELLIVDNASSDSSYQVCQEWSRQHRSQLQDFDVQVLSESKPGGNAARNCGLRACRGSYVFFFDSDDLFCGTALDDVAKAVNASRKNEESVGPDLLFLPTEQEYNGHVNVRAYRKSQAVHVQILSAMCCTQSMVFRTKWLQNIGGWDERLSVWQDWELGIRALQHKPRMVWLCEKAYHHVFVHTDSVTGGSLSQTLAGTLRTMRCVVTEVKESKELTQRERSLALLALYYRSMIFSGLLRREGNREGQKAYRILASEVMPHAQLRHRIFGAMLTIYVALGGRGAWRLALGILLA